jgi:hypothetical protein
MYNPLLAPLTPLLLLLHMTWTRLQIKRDDDRGITTEVLIITAILAACALAVVGAIARAITTKGGEVQEKIGQAGHGNP